MELIDTERRRLQERARTSLLTMNGEAIEFLGAAIGQGIAQHLASNAPLRELAGIGDDIVCVLKYRVDADALDVKVAFIVQQSVGREVTPTPEQTSEV